MKQNNNQLQSWQRSIGFPARPESCYARPMLSAPSTIEGRACGTCTLCCRLPEIDHFDKPADEWCAHCVAEQGCMIYGRRPSVCRDFHCLWMTDQALGEEWAPSRSHVMVYSQGKQITVLADPDRPDLWRRAPYMNQLQAWAAEAASSGGYVIVFWRDEVVKI